MKRLIPQRMPAGSRRHSQRIAWRAVAAWLTLAPVLAAAQTVDVDADAHRRIVAERAAAEQRYAAQERECRQRFVVSSCIDDARRARRAALQPLRERQIELDAARRRQAATERSESIAKKASDAMPKGSVSVTSRGTRKGSAAASVSASGASTAESGATLATPRKVPTPSKPAAPRPIEARIGDEAGNRAAFANRQREAAAHRSEVDARNAERDQKRKPSSPLPSPPGTSGGSTTGPSAPSVGPARALP